MAEATRILPRIREATTPIIKGLRSKPVCDWPHNSGQFANGWRSLAAAGARCPQRGGNIVRLAKVRNDLARIEGAGRAGPVAALSAGFQPTSGLDFAGVECYGLRRAEGARGGPV